MRTSDTGEFRRRQAISDLHHQRVLFPLATVRRIGAGLAMRRGAPDLATRLEWHFSGKAPLAGLRRDALAHNALMMASALPDEDFEPFVAATVLLLLERLSSDIGTDDGFWTWRRLSPHYRLAHPSLRAAIMCGFREAQRLGRISSGEGPTPDDCLTATRAEVLDRLGATGARPLLRDLVAAIRGEADPRHAGALWEMLHRGAASLPDAERQAMEAGARYLYERRLSMEPPSRGAAPRIPVHD